MRAPDTEKTVRLVLRVAAVITLILGLTILVDPYVLVGWFKGNSDGNTHFVRYIGTALAGFALGNWFSSQAADVRSTLPAVYGNLASLSLAIIVDATGLAYGSLNQLAWLILSLHATFIIAFSYCLYLLKA